MDLFETANLLEHIAQAPEMDEIQMMGLRDTIDHSCAELGIPSPIYGELIHSSLIRILAANQLRMMAQAQEGGE